MKNLNELLNSSDADVQEKELSSAIKSMLDKELKNDIMVSLKDKHGITKEHKKSKIAQEKTSPKTINFKPWISAVAAALVLTFGFYFIKSGSQTSEQLANQFAITDIVQHPGLTKGSNDENTKLADAIQYFNNKKWAEAAAELAKASPSDDVDYYQAMALFYGEKYNEAIVLFKKDNLQKSVFAQEVKWFLGLAYLLNHQEKEGKKILTTIQPNEWQYSKAKELVK